MTVQRVALLFLVPALAAANTAPDAPQINEPEFDGQIVNPADVHLETSPFSDPDSGPDGTFRNSDYEIWTISPAERVWASLNVTGVESFHNHLGAGSFENSHARRCVGADAQPCALRVLGLRARLAGPERLGEVLEARAVIEADVEPLGQPERVVQVPARGVRLAVQRRELAERHVWVGAAGVQGRGCAERGLRP